MTLEVFGAGLGRTGTNSLKLALEQLGLGPCDHMHEVAGRPERIARWTAAMRSGEFDWGSIFRGFRSAVDWPAATWWRQITAHYPAARVILTVRDPERWFDSLQATIFNPDMLGSAPPEFREMAELTVAPMFGDRPLDGRLNDKERCLAVYEAHNRAVIATIPRERLLVYRPGEGWARLCAFLDRDMPDTPFPHVNEKQGFLDRAAQLIAQPGQSPS